MIRVPAELARHDPEQLASMAGLRYVEADEPGYRRRRCGRGFSYLDADVVLSSPERDRLVELAVPPAWSDVWLCRDDIGHIQATGTDDAGRKQYQYHQAFREACDRQKFARLAYFARALIPIRRQVSVWLDDEVGSRDHAVGAVLRLIDVGLLRVGNRESADDGHHGATTLHADHVSAIDDTDGRDVGGSSDGSHVQLEYTGKSGKPRVVIIEDDELADILMKLADYDGRNLFWFTDDDGTEREVSALDVNAALATIVGPAFTAKDFRLWGGSRAVLEARVEGAGVLDAVDFSAAQLGNTRAVARGSYVHPRVLEVTEVELTEIWNGSRRSSWRSRGDSALAKLLRPV